MSTFIGVEPTVFVTGLGWLGVICMALAMFGLTLKRPAWGAGAVIAVTPLYQFRGTLGVPVTVLELLLGAFILGWLVQLKRYPLQRDYGWIWIGLILIGGLGAAFFSPDTRMGLGLWRAFWLEPALFLAAATAIFRKESATPILWGLLGSLAVVTTWSAVRWMTGSDLSYDGRLLGPYQSANFLAMAAVPVVLAAVFWPAKELPTDRVKYWLIRTVPTMLGVTLLAASHSRGGLIALTAGLLAGAVCFVRKVTRTQLIAGLLVAVIASLASIPLFFKRDEPIVPVRRLLIEHSTDFIAEKPWFGIGPNQFQARINERYYQDAFLARYYLPFAPNAHNLVLVIWSEWGIFTLVGFLGLLVTAFRRLVRHRSAAVAVPAAVLTAMLAHGLVDTPVLKNDLGIIFMTMIALSWTRTAVTRSKAGSTRRRSAA